MLFREEPKSKIWVGQNYLLLPKSSIQEILIQQEESFIQVVESLSPLEVAIVEIGLLPTIISKQEFENIILTPEQEQLLSIFQKQYRDISRWLTVFASPNPNVEANLKNNDSKWVKPLADFYWTMLDVLKICCREMGIGKNSQSDFLYLLWFYTAYSYFFESLKNGGFLMPLSNNSPKSKREFLNRWENGITPLLDATNAKVNDYSMFSETYYNWEQLIQQIYRIFFDICLEWGKKNNNNYKVINAVSRLWEQEKKLIDIINKRKGCGAYQVLTIHEDGIHVTRRNKPEGFGGKPSTSNKKSPRRQKNCKRSEG